MRHAISALLALVLAGCQSVPHTPGTDRYSQKHDAAPAGVPGTPRLQDPVPVAEPRSRYGNHSPYQVFGVTYHVMESAEGYAAEGLASWYGSKFHGHRTSSGEPYDMYALSAAHRSLPLPSWARVTNLDNGKSTIVRVNDRGPFHPDRIIDLSWAAAVKLGYEKQGTARVRVEAIVPDAAPQPPVRAAAAETPPPAGGLFLQLGAFRQLGSAQSMLGELAARFEWPVLIRPGDNLYRVWVGPFRDDAERTRARSELSRAGYRDAVNAAP